MEEKVVTPRQEEAVPCTQVYQYNMAGWLLDQERMRQADGRAEGMCYVYKPEDTKPMVWNRTVRACCEGWSGPHCSEDDLPSPFLLRPPGPTALLARSGHRQRPFATCVTWSSIHYRTFDGKHFRFHGTCVYALAAASDGTWAIYLSSSHGSPRALRMLFGLDQVVTEGRNVSVNGAPVPEGEARLQKGISVWWLGDFFFVESGLGVRVKFDGHDTVYVTVGADQRGATRGLCGVYNDDPTGGHWHCSQDPCPGECAVLGNSHYLTFDRKRYTFRGTCEYILVQDFLDGKLQITAENEACGSQGSASCLQAISVTVQKISARLSLSGEVSVNGQKVSLPFVSADLSVRWASSSFLLLQAFGAHILWGLESPAAYITLQPSFANKVRGLCGTYNWNQQDEFTSPEGDVESSTAAFAHKFRVTHDCPFSATLAPDPCSTYAQRREFAEAACAVLHGPSFQPCHDLVEREPFYQLCLYDVCGCSASRDCLCSAVAAYARRCAQEGVLVAWRNQSFCPVQCSGGQVYQECATPCQRSCADLGMEVFGTCQDLDRLCVAGCNCLEGLVLDDDGHVCLNGAWNCTDENCPQAVVCPGELVYAFGSCLRTCENPEDNLTCAGSSDSCVCPPGTVFLSPSVSLFLSICRSRRWECTYHHCAGKCVATGDPHYITFDGRAYTFLGDCEYILVHEISGAFTVTVENVPCGTSGTTCTKSVVVLIGNMVIHLLRGRVAGLCGNFDGNTENDFTSRQGIVEPTADLFGNSWRVSLLCPEVSSEDFEHPCTVNSHRVTWARKRCGILLQELFAPCHEELPCQQFYDWCVFDACGNLLQGWPQSSSTTACCIRHEAMQCDNGLEYDPCGPACPQTCKNFGLEPAEHCEAISCMEGCFCPEGKVLHGGHCIDPSECPCYWEGTLFPLGALVMQDCRNCSCEAGLWQCTAPLEPCDAQSHCTEMEFACHTGGRCVPSAWVCDNEDDCGDDSDEFCTLSCAPHQYQCASGQCVPWGYRCDGTADCLDHSDERGCPLLACAQQEFRCANGRCIPREHVCDGELDCGFADNSDEMSCGPPCGPSEFRCAVGRCLPYLHHCDGHDDCGDFSDEHGCLCLAGQFQCPEGQCLSRALVCDGEPDCPTGVDEAFCPGRVTCAPGQLPCPDGTCVSLTQVCDGVHDCADGADENPAQCPVTQTTPWVATIPPGFPATQQPPANRTFVPPCGRYEFHCQSGECQPRGWMCDNEADCLDGSDELQCNRTCGLDQFPCTLGGECIHYSGLCDGLPHCQDQSDESIDTCGSTQIPPCPGFFICNNRMCITVSRVCDGSPDCAQGEDELACGGEAEDCARHVCNGLADCADGTEASGWLPSDERDCGLWTPWAAWSACSRSCGTGLQVRQRVCTRRADDVLRHCLGEETQAQQCFSVACPVDGRWSEWTTWSNCTQDCRGVVVRRRECLPSQNGGLHCTEMPEASASSLEIRCWCPEGLVLNSEQQCLRPRECPCQVEGVRYWPGQLVKINCRICTCQDGQLKRCRQNPECTVNCGWSSWSPWGDCLGPCGVQSIQWSFRSPNNPSKHGNGRQCRGIYRKARRCQTEPCEECEHHGRAHAIGDRWRSGQCQVCQCLPNLTVQCSQYCPYSTVPCPEGRVLVEGWGDSCCYCTEAAENQTVIPTVPAVGPVWPTVVSSVAFSTLVPLSTFPLPPMGDLCYGPLGIASLPDTSFTASSEQPENPAHAARLNRLLPSVDLQGWAPPAEVYPDLLSQPPFLEVDLGEPRNLTGAGSSDAYVTSFFLQFSLDGVRWHDYLEASSMGTMPEPKFFEGNSDDTTPVVRTFQRTVQAQHVRILPRDFHNGIFLRMELLGCGKGGIKSLSPERPEVPTAPMGRRPCRTGEFQCQNGWCVQAGPNGTICNGVDDCGDLSDEWRCGLCYEPLGLEDGRVHYQQLSASSFQDGNPPDAGRLNIVPKIQHMEPGWSPRKSDPHPYFQVDFLQPTFVTAVVTQGSPQGYISHYRLAYSYDGVHFQNYTRAGFGLAKSLQDQDLNPAILTRILRLIPTEYHGSISLRMEVLGCPWSMMISTTSSQAPATASPGFTYMEETSLPPRFTGTPESWLPGAPTRLSEVTPAFGMGTSASRKTTVPSALSPKTQGLFWTTSQPLGPPVPSVMARTPGTTRLPVFPALPYHLGTPGLQPTLAGSTHSLIPGLPRILCTQGQFACEVFGCVEAAFVCDGEEDCLDGSDEKHCVDCILSPWNTWSECSRSCGLGVTFRRRDLLRNALPGGECDRNEFDSRSCFLRACPVNGGWASWGEWSDCDAECRGGVRSRTRACADPPPKNGGQPCPGDAVQMETCNQQPCGDARGCRCPPGLFLQDGGCVNISQCHCLFDHEQHRPGEMFLRNNCSQCVCLDGVVTCDSVACPVNCGWSAWSPSNPAAANGGAPCQGDAQEVRECHITCISEITFLWSDWTPWSPCSKTCFYATDVVGVRKRFRHCNGTAEAGTGCDGETVEEEPCDTPPCPVEGIWTPWTAWSKCSALCDSGVQTRNRTCSNPAYGGPECSGPLIQTRDCNTQPCKVQCPGNMVYQTVEECQRKGGACPRLCLDQGSQVECTSHCHSGCACPEGLFLQNETCLPLSQCPCYHQGGIYPPGSALLLDTCNNCTCIDGRMACTSEPCPASCNWSAWTAWSACSRTCNVGTRRRYRSEPPATTGREPCQGSNVEIEFCSLQSCQGLGMEWGIWSECSVPCGGGYRNRTRASPNILHRIQFATCNLHPCSGEMPGVCPEGKVWLECVEGPSSCAELSSEANATNGSCWAGCYCPNATVLLEECPCAADGMLYAPGDVVPKGCENCSCLAGQLGNCSRAACADVNGHWSEWTPWSECSASCGLGLQNRYHFCTDPAPSGMGMPCLGPEREDRACHVQPCARNGGWGPWNPWTICTVSCGGGMRSRTRACDSPTPQGGGDYCEGPPTQLEACGLKSCPGLDCSAVEGSIFSSCGPPCPRSCDDISHCLWACEPGCYCTNGKVLNENSTACIEKHRCTCLDLLSGRRYLPGDTIPHSDGCNTWTCGNEMVTRYRTCSCPKPQHGGPGCEGAQEYHGDSGVQLQRKECPTVTFCPGTPEGGNLSSWAGLPPWEYAQPGETVYGSCQNCTCVAGHLQCHVDPSCHLDGSWSSWGPWSPCTQSCGAGSQFRFRVCNNPPPQNGGRGCLGSAEQRRPCQDQKDCPEEEAWGPWSLWVPCSVSCGGGEQVRHRQCQQPECQGLATTQTKTCNTQVCLEAGCPEGRLYRECLKEEGCPYSCAHLTRQMDCFSDGCEEGCHCPVGTYQHQGACVQECPCILSEEALKMLRNHSSGSGHPLALLNAQGQPLSPGDEMEPNSTIYSACSNCSCRNGQLDCAFSLCPVDGGFSPWSPWSPCSLTCGGLGNMTRGRDCTNPIPANGGKDCLVLSGPTKEPISGFSGPEGDSFTPWTSWTPCSKTCSDPELPAIKTRMRFCPGGANCTGEAFQERECNLPQCTDAPLCQGEECLGLNCTWTPWAPWSACSRSCGVGQQRRLRTYHPPGQGGHWCPDILTANMERRFCNLQACKVDGAWSKWSPWSWCDRLCGGGRSSRTRACSSPPPKNGGRPCPEEGCPPPMRLVDCANVCPRHCWDLQEGIECQDGEACEPGCRCPDGTLEQDGTCVSPGHCECTDAQGHSWAPGSLHDDGCNNCSCLEGQLLCTNHTCLPSECAWSLWSGWAPCSVTCRQGLRTRFRTSTSGSWAPECLKEQLQTHLCAPGPCPPLCLHEGHEMQLGTTWLLGECQQWLEPSLNGAWTPWSPWSDCPVTCGQSTQIRTRACINPPPRNNGLPCTGPEVQTQNCSSSPCPGDELCAWSTWSPCSRSCGTGLASRTGLCSCPSPEDTGEAACNHSLRQEVAACYLQACKECPWSSWTAWTRCSCSFLVQQRYRNQQGYGADGEPCVGLDGQFRMCDYSQCSDSSCEPPFQFQTCGSPCDSLCSTLRHPELCRDIPRCLPGCYCPQGLVEQNGACVLPPQCGCLHLSQSDALVYLAAGETLLIGCKEWGTSSAKVMAAKVRLLPLSAWSEWTPCSPCLPLMALSPQVVSLFLAQHQPWPQEDPSAQPALVSMQHRYRLCLDPQTGRPWEGQESLCSAELEQEQLCPDPHACEASGQQQPLKSHSLAHLWPGGSLPPHCRSPEAAHKAQQISACGVTGPPGVRVVSLAVGGFGCVGAPPITQLMSAAAKDCGSSHRVATQPPVQGRNVKIEAKSMPPPVPMVAHAPAWTSGNMSSVCKGGASKLLQDGVCVPIPTCRCGLPTFNSTLEFMPGQLAELDCHNCTCVNGTFVCPDQECPSYGEWSAWTPCSASCGGGNALRHRLCHETSGGAPCAADTMEEIVSCNPQPCPTGCLLSEWSVWSPCSLSCGGGVSERSRDLLSPPEEEPCLVPLLQHQNARIPKCILTVPTLARKRAPICTHKPSAFRRNASQAARAPLARCTQKDCNVPCIWSEWSPWSPCSVTCGDGERVSRRYQLQQRLYGGLECEGPAVRWTSCSLTDCEEPQSHCRHYTELRNITKGSCFLADVAVSYCSGWCASHTNVIPEEPYLQTLCECCSYHLDPVSPVRILNLQCQNGETEPVVLPVIHACECSSCQSEPACGVVPAWHVGLEGHG
ncbi:hypothetical protein JD844_003874 [Phrynosoma platyrhinos]|uniref:SCO-spondin n=1 Tax=Phrynosoma platyrhinos TaxID=52577 RepID=A0ABQ7TDN1_PHRPL|nr:hypothetical protein JD844_003874 [Phrynosoma platyrhinos]